MDYIKKTIEQERFIAEFDSKKKCFAEKYFVIGDSVDIDEKLLKEVCPTLRALLINKKDLSDRDLGVILQHSTNLELLEIDGWPEITFEGLSIIQGEHLNLKHLQITECPEITDEGIFFITEKFPNLQDLTVGPFCFGTTKGFQHVINKNNNFIRLELDMCDVSQEQVKTLVEGCPNLIILHIEHSETLRKEGLEFIFNYLSKKYPHLAIWFH